MFENLTQRPATNLGHRGSEDIRKRAALDLRELVVVSSRGIFPGEFIA
jgi:hypothetical protein